MGMSCGKQENNIPQFSTWARFNVQKWLPPWFDALLIKTAVPLRFWGWLIGKYYKPWERRVSNGELFMLFLLYPSEV
jgi:hypothetical protein